MLQERSSGDLSRSFVGGTMQQVDDGVKARDGQIFLFIAADWAHLDTFDLKPFLVTKGIISSFDRDGDGRLGPAELEAFREFKPGVSTTPPV